MKRIGLFGGTFDPPHYGHLLMAEHAYQQMELDEVWFIPSFKPPHKEEANTTAKDRVEMTRIAIQDHPAFSVHTIEVDREEKSYTVHTIKLLQEQYPDVQFYFIIGGDMVEYLPNWYRINELMELVPFIGVKRPGYTLDSIYNVEEVEMPLIEISSTLIRDRLQSGESVRYLTSPEVIAMINKYQLYS
ncbi:nicotinate-nucleotide adenylyltransferase [Gracilibacillus salinarum]|uniref:Probable nicotinate-nucleotide adenylyltransferase n=1 Tax=Gracilibacillus salinarum TaxID=2932255 RepID=A0ABY4GPD0_9BACI|nr:nicotinate-nucleotide adenylyltransferase [Gracilibacillus salinarum]UOQ86084.1 nicotinate-nucleotide adenylyltransferase [Gracilibacillus salinarum]